MKLKKLQIQIEPYSSYSTEIINFDFESRFYINLSDFLDCDDRFYENIGETLNDCRWCITNN